MMLPELSLVLQLCPTGERNLATFKQAIVTQNGLNKRSAKTRDLTYRHLVDLYGLDEDLLTFRALSFFWDRDPDGQPLLALTASLARDTLLRETAPTILKQTVGSRITREAVEESISTRHPDRFSPAMLKSLAQNINASFTQSGHLQGRAIKHRQAAKATPGTVAYGLLLSYASGARGPELFETIYLRVQDLPKDDAFALAEQAHRRGWLSFKRIGDVIEVDFPQLIQETDREAMREQS